MKIAVVGYGYWGKNLFRNFADLYGAADLKVCDSDSRKLKDIKEAYPLAQVTLNLSNILTDDEIGAVVISTPAVTHYQLAKECILAGKDIFVEKPLSLTVEEGMELVKLSEINKRILMVGHLLEYHSGILKLKELIDSGELGKISYIYSNRLNLGKIRREENILWSFAPHDISVMLLLLNEMPVAVSAHGGNYLHKNIADVTISFLEFKSGTKGHIFVSWLHPYKEQKLIVVGEKKMAVFDDVAEKDKLLLFNHKIESVAGVPVSRKEEAEVVAFEATEPLKQECRHFIQCVTKRKKPDTDGKKGVDVLRVLQACSSSLERNGDVVKLTEKAQKHENPNHYIHETAIVEAPCNIGEGTKIWHYSHISKGAKIGKNCHLGQNVFVGSKADIGNGVKIQNNVSVYDCVKLEDDVFCGPSMIFTNVINPRSHISRKHEFKKTLVKKGATLGANSTIICGITIGEYAFIGAGAVVTKDVPLFGLVYGNPARLKGWMCQCGIKLNFKDDKAECQACKARYMLKNNLVRRK